MKWNTINSKYYNFLLTLYCQEKHINLSSRKVAYGGKGVTIFHDQNFEILDTKHETRHENFITNIFYSR